MTPDTPQQDEQEPDTGPQGTRVFRREDIKQQLTGREDGAGTQDGTSSGAVLVGINGVFQGRRIGLPLGRSTLGRDVANNIIVDDDSVSLVHARLVEKNGEWRVLNLLSTNGTWVNNEKVSDGVLRDGDSVCFGQAEFMFHTNVASRPAGFWSRLRSWLRIG